MIASIRLLFEVGGLKFSGSNAGIRPAASRLTKRAEKVLELALREALSLGHENIMTEHILLAIARDKESVAAQVLQERGLTTNEIRSSIMRLRYENTRRIP